MLPVLKQDFPVCQWFNQQFGNFGCLKVTSIQIFCGVDIPIPFPHGPTITSWFCSIAVSADPCPPTPPGNPSGGIFTCVPSILQAGPCPPLGQWDIILVGTQPPGSTLCDLNGCFSVAGSLFIS